MSDRELMERIRALENECLRLSAIEAIKQLKYRYWYYNHTGQWHRVGDCFSEDAIFDFGQGPPLQGRTQIGQFFVDQASRSTELVVLHGHNPEIHITGPTTARGRWQLDNIRLDVQNRKGMRMGNSYEEEYVKEDGEWKIGKSCVAYLFVQEVDLAEINSG